MNKGPSLARKLVGIFVLLFLFFPNRLFAQSKQDTLPPNATIADCVNYALLNYTLVKQLVIDEAINKRDIRIALSGWWPQINSSTNLQHYIQQPVAIFPNLSDPTGPRLALTSGVANSSAIQFGATQNIYSTE